MVRLSERHRENCDDQSYCSRRRKFLGTDNAMVALAVDATQNETLLLAMHMATRSRCCRSSQVCPVELSGAAFPLCR